MVRKSSHPDRQLFDYLNGTLNERASQSIEQHLTNCADCGPVADVVRALKSQASGPEDANAHPDISEIAAFFYDKSSGVRDRKTAAHVAMCRSCAEELALYVQVERAAAGYDSSKDEAPAPPRLAWDMIENWEDTVYAGPKPEIEPLGEEMLNKLARLLYERKSHLVEIEQNAAARSHSGYAGDLVPVIVVSKSGEFRGVEMFESAADSKGVSLLKHPDKSARFDNKPFHALLDFGEEKYTAVSYLIRRDSVKLEHVPRQVARLPHASYFIIED